MAFRLAELFVDITAKTSAFDGELRSVRGALSATLTGMKGLVSGAASSLFAPMVGAANLASTAIKGAFLAMALGAAAGTAYAINQASDLNETASAAGVVFGKSARIVGDAADQMAKDLGVPKQEFMDSAMGIGLMGKAAKMTQKDAAELGVRMAKLGADTASFRNIRLDEALEKIRAGLSGEAEPLRTLGVMLSEDAVKAEALKLKLAKVGDELTEGQKVIARASLITKGLADANGDLARTQDGVANRLREIQGRFQNLAAELGQNLLPATKRIAEGLTDALKGASTFLADNKETFDQWAKNLENAASVGISAFKHWPEALQVVKEFAKEKVTNIREVFDWLLANIPPVMDRIALAIREGFEEGMKAAIDVVKNKTDFIRGLMSGALTGVAPHPDSGNLLPQKTPRAFVPLNLTGSTDLAGAFKNFGDKHAEDEGQRTAKTPAEIVAEGMKNAAEYDARAKEQSTFAGRRGLRQDTPFADAARKKALEELMARTPAEVAQADEVAAKKKKTTSHGVVDADSYARELQEGALKGGDVEKDILKEAQAQTKILTEIEKKGAMKPLRSTWG